MLLVLDTAPVFRPSEAGWQLKASLPGLSAKDASVEVCDNSSDKLLTIKAAPRFSKEYRCGRLSLPRAVSAFVAAAARVPRSARAYACCAAYRRASAAAQLARLPIRAAESPSRSFRRRLLEIVRTSGAFHRRWRRPSLSQTTVARIRVLSSAYR